jgi:hypothetical protein
MTSNPISPTPPQNPPQSISGTYTNEEAVAAAAEATAPERVCPICHKHYAANAFPNGIIVGDDTVPLSIRYSYLCFGHAVDETKLQVARQVREEIEAALPYIVDQVAGRLAATARRQPSVWPRIPEVRW